MLRFTSLIVLIIFQLKHLTEQFRSCCESIHSDDYSYFYSAVSRWICCEWMSRAFMWVSACVCVWPNRSLSNLFDFWLANLLAIHFDSLNIIKIVWKCKRMLIEIQYLLLLAYTCAVCVCFYLSSSFSRCVHIELCCQYLPIRISYGNVPVFLWHFL